HDPSPPAILALSLHDALPILAPLGLTAMQWRPIAILARGIVDTPAGLARILEVDTGAITRTLDRLEAKSLLRRVRCTEDRRVVQDRKSTRLNSSHVKISYAVF